MSSSLRWGPPDDRCIMWMNPDKQYIYLEWTQMNLEFTAFVESMTVVSEENTWDRGLNNTNGCMATLIGLADNFIKKEKIVSIP